MSSGFFATTPPRNKPRAARATTAVSSDNEDGDDEKKGPPVTQLKMLKLTSSEGWNNFQVKKLDDFMDSIQKCDEKFNEDLTRYLKKQKAASKSKGEKKKSKKKGKKGEDDEDDEGEDLDATKSEDDEEPDDGYESSGLDNDDEDIDGSDDGDSDEDRPKKSKNKRKPKSKAKAKSASKRKSRAKKAAAPPPPPATEAAATTANGTTHKRKSSTEGPTETKKPKLPLTTTTTTTTLLPTAAPLSNEQKMLRHVWNEFLPPNADTRQGVVNSYDHDTIKELKGVGIEVPQVHAWCVGSDNYLECSIQSLESKDQLKNNPKLGEQIGNIITITNTFLNAISSSDHEQWVTARNDITRYMNHNVMRFMTPTPKFRGLVFAIALYHRLKSRDYAAWTLTKIEEWNQRLATANSLCAKPIPNFIPFLGAFDLKKRFSSSITTTAIVPNTVVTPSQSPVNNNNGDGLDMLIMSSHSSSPPPPPVATDENDADCDFL